MARPINPTTGSLWCSTNERDDLGNHLVPDYVTSVPEGGFFGWPWYYMGGHQDPRLPKPCADGTGPNPQLTAPLTAEQAADCKRVDLSSKVTRRTCWCSPTWLRWRWSSIPPERELPRQL